MDVYGYCLDDPVNLVDPLGLEGKATGDVKGGAKALGAFAMGKAVEKLPGDVGVVGKGVLDGYSAGAGMGMILGIPVFGTVGAIAGGVYGYGQTQTRKDWEAHMENGGSDLYEEYE